MWLKEFADLQSMDSDSEYDFSSLDGGERGCKAGRGYSEGWYDERQGWSYTNEGCSRLMVTDNCAAQPCIPACEV
jgi:hypothetical protein